MFKAHFRNEYGRKTFAAYYDVDSKTDVSEEVTFPDFVNLIVNVNLCFIFELKYRHWNVTKCELKGVESNV